MQLLVTANVAPSCLNKVVTICAEMMLGEERCARDMELPDEKFGLGLRTELGALHTMVAGVALARADSIASLQNDESPLDQRSLAVAPMQLDDMTPDGAARRRRWHGTGAYELSGKSGKDEADAVKAKVFDRLAAAVESVRTQLVLLHGATDADAILATKAAGATLKKLVGAILSTDNASAARMCQKELMLLVEKEMRAEMGDEWDKLTPEQQQKLVKVWCVRARARWAHSRTLSKP